MEASGELHTPAVLPLAKERPVPIEQVAGSIRSQSFGEEINFLPLSGIEPRFLGHPAGSLITNRLSHPGSLLRKYGCNSIPQETFPNCSQQHADVQHTILCAVYSKIQRDFEY